MCKHKKVLNQIWITWPVTHGHNSHVNKPKRRCLYQEELLGALGWKVLNSTSTSILRKVNALIIALCLCYKTQTWQDKNILYPDMIYVHCCHRSVAPETVCASSETETDKL